MVYDADKLWSKVSDSQAEQNTLERWNHWRQGLLECKSHFGNGTTPKLIAHALETMQRAQVNAS